MQRAVSKGIPKKRENQKAGQIREYWHQKVNEASENMLVGVTSGREEEGNECAVVGVRFRAGARCERDA